MTENLGWPRKNNTGSIGKSGKAWKDLYVETVHVGGVSYAWPAADGSAGYQLTTDGAGTLSWAAAGGASSCAWDDISNPDANKTITFGTYTTLLTGAATAGDQWTFRGTGNFGDVSVVKIESLTGNPTDGTVLEVVSHDTDADALLVVANSATRIQVYGSGNVDIVGGTGALTFTDWSITADAVLTLSPDDSPAAVVVISPSAAATTGIDLSSGNLTNAISVGSRTILGTTAVIDFTNFDVSAAGAVTCVSLSAGQIKMDAIVPSSASPATITLDGGGTGGVTVGGTSTGTITLGGGSVLVNLPANTDLTLAGGVLSITDTATANLVTMVNNTMTANSLVAASSTSMTSGKMISAIGGAAVSGDLYYAQATEGAGFTGYYFRGYDGAANDITIGRNGAVVITGAGTSADMLTLTSGTLQITAGNIDLDNGNLAVDTAQDLASNITRDFNGVGTGPVLTVKDDHTASTNVALQVTQDGTAGTALGVTATGTGNATAVSIAHSGDLPAISISAGAARTGDVITVTMANQLAQKAINISGAWTGANAVGLITLASTGVLAAGASMLLIDTDTAQPADSDGWALSIDDDTLVVATPSKYAVKIDSAANEALHVATGKALFDEEATFTTGINVDAGVDIDMASNDITVNIDSAATGHAAGTGIVTVYGSGAAGQTNATYLLRLVWKANADAQDNFILCQDNSTGAVANGTEAFSVSTGGVCAARGGFTSNGPINLVAQSELTISVGGAVTRTKSYHTIDTNADDASDDLDTISGGAEGDLIVIRPNNAGRTVVVKNGTGNIICGSDFTMDNNQDTWVGLYDGSNWLELARKDNAA